MKGTKPEKLTEQLRQLVLSSGESRYRIAKEAGIDETALSRFINGKRGVSMTVLDKLGEHLGLAIVQVRKTQGAKAGKSKGG